MSMINELKAMGLDVDEGLDRVMGDEDLYTMMLGMFVDSVRDNAIEASDFDKADLDGLIKRVHTLKGVTGNLAITPLFEGYNQALVLLRAGNAKAAKAEYEKLLPAQADILDCINKNR